MTQPSFKTLLARASELSKDLKIAAGPDADRARCDALVERMRAAELMAVSVPERLGGLGLGVQEIAALTYEIARQSGSAGLLYAMHMSQAYSLTTHAEGSWFDALQRRMLEGQLIIASGTSEKGPGGDILTSICRTELQPDGRICVSKQSPNVSYVDHADLILVTAKHAVTPKRSKQVLIAAEVDRSQFVQAHKVSLMGMRGLLNGPWQFVISSPTEAIFSTDFAAIARRTMTPSIQIFWAALWSGIVHGVLDKTRLFVAQEVPQGSEAATLSNHTLTRLVDQHHMMNTMIRDAVAAFSSREDARDMGFGLSAQINRIKVNCSELAVAICTGALGLVGIRGYATGGPYTLAEPLADILSGPIMVANLRLSLNNAQIERFVDERLFPLPSDNKDLP